MYNGSSDTIQVQNANLIPDREDLKEFPEPEFEVSAIRDAQEIIDRVLVDLREEYYQSDTEGNESTEVENKVVVLNEEFQINDYDNYIVISHPRWLLAGKGKAIKEAKEDLIAEAEIFADSYLSLSDDELTQDGIKMRDFIAELLNV